jgi:regulator of sigma E protease
LQWLLAFLVAIGVLVAVHEFGHYIVARLLGVKVLRYSIGFGRPIWIRQSGPDRTEYCLSAIPFGGYVKLLDERDCAVALSEQHRAFNRQPVPTRVAILAAGPVLNFVFAIVACWLMFVIGFPGVRPIVGEVTAGAVAARAGLHSGDEIVRVGERSAATWEGVIVSMLDQMLGKGTIKLEIKRAGVLREINLPVAGRESELTEPGQLFTGLGFRPWTPKWPAVISETVPGGPAARAGLRSGDRVLRVDNLPVDSWPTWVEFLRKRPGQRVQVVVERDHSQITLPLEIERTENAGAVIGRIGATGTPPPSLPEQWKSVERFGPVEAIGRAADRTWEMSVLTVRIVVRMVTGEVSVRNISGPISIAEYAGYSASAGFANFLSFLAGVSLSLGILNLLPIPMLDGGQIVYQLAEAAKGSPLSERAQLVGQQVGVLFLLLLMSFAVYNDISRLLG